jgi:hypothetical protein
MTALQKVVTPLKNGVQVLCTATKRLDSGVSRNDGKGYPSTFRETVKDGVSLFLLFLKIILVFLICHVKKTAQQ